MTKEQVDHLKTSLEKFNLVEIPAIDIDNTIIAGHQRLKILQMIGRGEEEIDVRVPNRKLTEEEFREYNIRSNKNIGEWNFDELANNFDLGELNEWGFGLDELEKLFSLTREDEFDADKEYVAIKEPTTKLGDLFALGQHRLLCGDAAKEDDVVRLMVAERGRMVFTDPPYNVNYRSPAYMHHKGTSYESVKYGGTGKKIFNDDKSDEDCLKFYTDVLNNLYQYTTNDCTIYWWFANANNWINREAFKLSKWKMSQIIIWLKNSMVFSPGQDYHRMYEPCMMGWKEGKKHYKNKKIGNYKDVFNLDVTDFEELLDVWYQHRDQTAEYVHPTQKPVRLAERALKKNSEPNDIVIDLFGGSG